MPKVHVVVDRINRRTAFPVSLMISGHGSEPINVFLSRVMSKAEATLIKEAFKSGKVELVEMTSVRRSKITEVGNAKS